LLKLDHLSGVLHRSTHHPAPVREIHWLLLRLLALNRIADQDDRLIPVAQFCRDQASGRTEALAPELTLPGIAQPLGRQITQTLQSIRKPPEHAAAKGPHGLFSADAFTNPDHTRFALKVTLAVMLCYSLQDGLDWPGIHTCIITCYFVSLATVGETVYKATLRLVGCLIGGALGIGAILTVMPFMTNLGHLLLLLAPVTFLCGWIGFGSERIAYAGLQIGLAFYLSTLQGFGPTLDMETARDRIIGILIGNVVIFLIFTTIWPVSTARVVRANLAKAVDLLGTLFRADSAEHRAGFAQAIGQARSVIVNEPFETRSVLAADGRRPIDAGILARVQALFIPVSVLLDLRHDPAWEGVPDSTRTMMDAHQTALANWFQRAANWIRTGEGADDVAESLPETLLFPAAQPQGDHVAALVAWYRLLQHDILAILHQVGPRALAGPAAEPGELRFAAG
jgi:multidrug resistance protein MdtO